MCVYPLIRKELSLNYCNTQINGSKIGKGRCAVLRDFDILSLASPEHIRYPSGEIEDYRFQFHHMVVRSARAAIDALYTKQYHLGSGAFGEVWKGLDHTHNRIVAIKTVNVRGQGEQTQSKKLKAIGQEITIMERLAHPNICELFQFYYDRPGREIREWFGLLIRENSGLITIRIDIIMEFVEGGDLYKFIVKNATICTCLLHSCCSKR
jgi:ser/thr/tyr protein kinase RAD53